MVDPKLQPTIEQHARMWTFFEEVLPPAGDDARDIRQFSAAEDTYTVSRSYINHGPGGRYSGRSLKLRIESQSGEERTYAYRLLGRFMNERTVFINNVQVTSDELHLFEEAIEETRSAYAAQAEREAA
jgi:hypothetical protein